MDDNNILRRKKERKKAGREDFPQSLEKCAQNIVSKVVLPLFESHHVGDRARALLHFKSCGNIKSGVISIIKSRK
jgi:hypothetical protein